MQASSVKVAWKVMSALGIYAAVLGLLWILLTKKLFSHLHLTHSWRGAGLIF